MKPTSNPLSRSNRGSVLLVVMGTIIVLAVALAAVLSLTTHENRILARTEAWNAALPAAEAGIEEAMSHLQQVQSGSRKTNGWTQDGGSFVLSRKLTDSQYTVAIAMETTPDILSRGEVWCPSAGRMIARTVLVTTQRQAAGRGGINAKGTIKLSGDAYLDSFDSSDPNYSTNGMYDVTKRKDNGLALSNLGTAGAIAVGTGKIYGNATTGPGGTVTYGAGGAVGDAAWIAGGNVGAQAGHVGTDANAQFPTPPPPFPYGTGQNLTGGVVSGFGTTNWIYALTGGNYNAVKVTVSSGGNPMLIRGDVTLYVSDDFTVSGSGYVYLAPGATLKLYVGGKFTVSGGGVYNGTGLAKNLNVYGLSTSIGQGWTYSGSANFVGTVDAPVISKLTVSGGASVFGSITANNFEITGGGHISFDESLGAKGGYRIASWTEL